MPGKAMGYPKGYMKGTSGKMGKKVMAKKGMSGMKVGGAKGMSTACKGGKGTMGKGRM